MKRFWEIIAIVVIWELAVAFVVTVCTSQTVTVMSRAHTPTGCVMGIIFQIPLGDSFCLFCSTNGAPGPWWRCSGTLTQNAGESLTNILNLGTNVATGLVKARIYE